MHGQVWQLLLFMSHRTAVRSVTAALRLPVYAIVNLVTLMSHSRAGTEAGRYTRRNYSST